MLNKKNPTQIFERIRHVHAERNYCKCMYFHPAKFLHTKPEKAFSLYEIIVHFSVYNNSFFHIYLIFEHLYSFMNVEDVA